MIQRIQSVYLFLIVVLGVLSCLMPMVVFVNLDESTMWELRAFGMKNIAIEEGITNVRIPVAGLSVLGLTTAFIPLFALVDIFLFKRRILQARLNIFLAMLCLGFYAILGVYIWFVVAKWGMDWSFTVWASFPLICFVLTLMATRGILRDEALVRAADRLR